jgi:hypothetical protein
MGDEMKKIMTTALVVCSFAFPTATFAKHDDTVYKTKKECIAAYRAARAADHLEAAMDCYPVDGGWSFAERSYNPEWNRRQGPSDSGQRPF